MGKFIEELDINSDGILIISSVHEKIKNILQIDLQTKREEAAKIFEESDLTDVENSELALNIIEYFSGENDIDKAKEKLLRSIKTDENEAEKSFKVVLDFKKKYISLDEKKLELIIGDIYKRTKGFDKILKNTNVEVENKMSLWDKIYFEIRNGLMKNFKNETKALNPGTQTEQKPTKREELLASLFFDGVEIGDDGKPVEENLSKQPELSKAEGKEIDD